MSCHRRSRIRTVDIQLASNVGVSEGRFGVAATVSVQEKRAMHVELSVVHDDRNGQIEGLQDTELSNGTANLNRTR